MTARRLAQLTAIVESVPIGIVVADREGRIALSNPEAERLFGYGSGELDGRMVDVLVPERFRGRHPELRAGYAGEPLARPMGAGRDLFGLRRDGTEFPIEIGLNPVETEQGLYVVSVIADISERARQARALQSAKEALERSNVELQRFAYIASHDLQSPLRSIASFVELLHATYAEGLDDRARDWFARTRRAVQQLQTLVADLLQYARIDSRAHPFERVALRDVLDDAVSLLQASVRDAQADVTSVTELPEVWGDRSQLVQVLLNLVGNGLKYRSAQPPRIEVGARLADGAWEIAVRDNGIGIAPQYHERIFEMFERLHDHGEYPGTGIGLAVCRRIINRHRGRLWVESVAGAGSRFIFTLPAVPPESR